MSDESTEESTTETERVVVCPVDDLEVGEAKRFDVGEYRIALVRGEEGFFAIGDECSHADFSLAEGEVDLEDCTLECWKHGSLFSLTTGEAKTLPATRAVPVYVAAVVDGEVAVDLPRSDS